MGGSETLSTYGLYDQSLEHKEQLEVLPQEVCEANLIHIRHTCLRREVFQ